MDHTSLTPAATNDAMAMAIAIGLRSAPVAATSTASPEAAARPGSQKLDGFCRANRSTGRGRSQTALAINRPANGHARTWEMVSARRCPSDDWNRFTVSPMQFKTHAPANTTQGAVPRPESNVAAPATNPKSTRSPIG